MAEAPTNLAGRNGPQRDHPPPSVLKPPRKRRRIVISCTECHRRKQKVSGRLLRPSATISRREIEEQNPLFLALADHDACV